MPKWINRWQVSTFAVGFLSCISALVLPAQLGAQTEPFSLICMPDPQYYTTSANAGPYGLYRRQAEWIRDNRSAQNIKHVIWLGDLTNNNYLSQWNVASDAYSVLNNNNIPYAVVPGNHDYMTTNDDAWAGAHLRNLGRFNNNLGPQKFAGKSWYGGNMGETNNKNENNYTYFSSNGLDFLVIGLEYAPRKEVLTWANNLISQHPNHRVILFTHAYMTTNGRYSGAAGSAAGTVGAAGADLFDECASRHSNVFMVVCGHVTESVVNSKTGVNGNTIYEMLVDYQGEKVKGTGNNLGNGWLRILKFNPDTNRINASTVTAAHGDSDIFLDGITKFYNGPYDKHHLLSDHNFSLNYNMSAPMPPYSYLNASTRFHAMGVSGDLHSDELDADIGQADNGDWAIVWEDDSDDNGVYTIRVRGFDSDGNVRFNKSYVNTTAVNLINCRNPSIAMAPDGKFVVVWHAGTTKIQMRAYNADGTPIGSEQTVVSVPVTGTVSNPDVAIADNGNFVVCWRDDEDGNNYHQVRARGFTHNYTERFTTKNVNTISAGNQVNPVIAMAGNGNYVVAWEDDKDGTWDVGMRGFLANESEWFAQTLANVTTEGEQLSPDIGMDDASRFVIVWEDDADLNNAYQIKARGFRATGAQLFSERTVNVDATGNQINPAVTMDSTGNWYPVWEDNGVPGDGYQIMANAFNVSGSRINAADSQVNPVSKVTHNFGPAVRKSAVVSAHKSGRYIVAWSDDMDGNMSHQILACGVSGTAKSLAIKSINGSVTRSATDAFYAPGASLTLTPVGNPGHSFVRWSGDVPAGSQTANPLTITMNTNKIITAEFTASTEVGDWPLY